LRARSRQWLRERRIFSSGALVAGMFVVSLRSERTPAIAGTAAVIGVLLAGHLVFSLHAKTGWSDVAVVPWIAVAAAIGQAVRAKQAHAQDRQIRQLITST
jgi:hypothetical protein